MFDHITLISDRGVSIKLTPQAKASGVNLMNMHVVLVDGDKVVIGEVEYIKDDIIDVQNKFIKSGLEEKNIKFLVIRNIDFANKQVLNCLLKFIERQNPSVYIIFSTFNYANILPTIKSRCATITITKNDGEINSFLNKTKLSRQEKKTIIKE